MANKERISCDYQGCDKEFTFRVGPFNICSTHYWDEEKSASMRTLMKKWVAEHKVSVHGS